jgi:hypothetical protein
MSFVSFVSDERTNERLTRTNERCMVKTMKPSPRPTPTNPRPRAFPAGPGTGSQPARIRIRDCGGYLTISGLDDEAVIAGPIQIPWSELAEIAGRRAVPEEGWRVVWPSTTRPLKETACG